MVWEVNRILEVRRRRRGFHYLVDWVGSRPEDRSWVPRSYLADPSLLEDFYKANPSAIRQSPGVSRREGGPVAGAATHLLALQKPDETNTPGRNVLSFSAVIP